MGMISAARSIENGQLVSWGCCNLFLELLGAMAPAGKQELRIWYAGCCYKLVHALGVRSGIDIEQQADIERILLA